MLSRFVVPKTLALAAVCIAAGLLVGCDTQQRKADQAAADKMKAVESARLAAADIDQLQSVEQQYDELAGNVGDLSPRMHALIRGRQAEVRFEVATLMLADLRSEELGIIRTIDEIQNLAVQIAGSQASVASLQAYDPTSEINDLHAKEAAIQGAAGDTSTGSTATLAGVNSAIDKLNDQITQNQAQTQSLQQSRDQALSQAEDLTRKSEAETGDQQLQDTIQSSQLRRDAGETDAHIDTLKSQLAMMQTDLNTLNGQKSGLESSVTALDTQIAALQAGWATMQQQMDAQRQLQQQIIGSDSSAAAQVTPPAPPADGSTDTSAAPVPVTDNSSVTIASLAARLTSMLTDASTKRDALNQELDNAISQFGEAEVVAEQMRSQLLPQIEGLTPTPDAPIWKETMGTLHPMYFNLQKAAAMQDEASVAASNAVIQVLLGRLFDGYDVTANGRSIHIAGLTAILSKDQTGIDPPNSVATLQRSTPDAIKQLESDVDDKFKSALDAYDQRYGADSGQSASDQNNLALIGRVYTNRKWAQYSTLIGDADAASQHLRDADSDDSQVDPAFRTAGQSAPPAPAQNPSAPQSN
ncbi:MAG: hypothetical protein ABSF29_02890 [Tepidisphaeraceae bacterium]|jgi:DNA repair exonuclease SbcCD ATPase subunit